MVAASAFCALELSLFIVPRTTPGGKPVIEDAGYTPRSPARVVAPVLVTPDPASTEYVPAVPSCTPPLELVSANRGAGCREPPNITRVMGKPTSPNGTIDQKLCLVFGKILHVPILGTVAVVDKHKASFCFCLPKDIACRSFSIKFRGRWYEVGGQWRLEICTSIV